MNNKEKLEYFYRKTMEYTSPIREHIENLLLETLDIDYSNTSSLEKTPKQIIWEIRLPYREDFSNIENIWKITKKLPSLTQLVIEERENE